MKSFSQQYYGLCVIASVFLAVLMCLLAGSLFYDSKPASAQTKLTCQYVPGTASDRSKCASEVARSCKQPSDASREACERQIVSKYFLAQTNIMSCQTRIAAEKCAEEIKKKCNQRSEASRDACELEVVLSYRPKYSSTTCNVKINKDRCTKEVEQKCKKPAGGDKQFCETSIIQKYKDITPTCTNKQNPQACHKEVVEKCGQDPPLGIAPSQGRIRCIEGAIAGHGNVADTTPNNTGQTGTIRVSNGLGGGKYQCGKGKDAIMTKINFGCVGESYPQATLNPILDVAYAIIRFLSYGVGLVLIIAMILTGVQYSTSEGNPETTAAAKKRITAIILGLFIYIFTFAILQYLVPGGLFNPGAAMWISLPASGGRYW